MATFTQTHAPSLFGVPALFENLREAHARRRLYRKTLNELYSLSNRELADLGLHRSSLRRVAWQAANEA